MKAKGMKWVVIALALVAANGALAAGSSIWCNPGAMKVVPPGGQLVTIKSHMGAFLTIPATCTENNVCKITYTTNATSDNPFYTDNNNALTNFFANSTEHLTNQSGVFYAYAVPDKTNSGQCLNRLNFGNPFKVSYEVVNMGQSAQTVTAEEGVQFH